MEQDWPLLVKDTVFVAGIKSLECVDNTTNSHSKQIIAITLDS